MTSYRIPAGILRAEMGGEEVLLNPGTGTYHLINATGRALLTHIEAGRSFEDAVRTLREETGEPAERVISDADAFAESMVTRGLLERVELP